jgi:hypothetical protein
VEQRKQLSGKLVILGIVGVALAAAGTSWWFRYAATRRAAEFYGDHVRLIRDAPVVELLQFDLSTAGGFVEDELRMDALNRFLERPTSRQDISTAPGLTHLRAALLEDRSYIWPSRSAKPSDLWQWILVFRNDQSGGGVVVMFSPDWKLVTVHGQLSHTEGGLVQKVYVSNARVVSCEPIAAGLAQMLEELAQDVPASR